jgi:hypothetical protein
MLTNTVLPYTLILSLVYYTLLDYLNISQSDGSEVFSLLGLDEGLMLCSLDGVKFT